ncbi:MAG: Hpt domain-containing protein [Pseudomonadota bacterium]
MSGTRDEKIAAARARMAELAAKFVDRSGREFESLRAGLARFAAGDATALDDIRHLAHRMCGTGATLGFGVLSDCAARIEHLADAQTPGKKPDESALTRFAAGLEALGAELMRLRADPS